jgi:hypothetical protein
MVVCQGRSKPERSYLGQGVKSITTMAWHSTSCRHAPQGADWDVIVTCRGTRRIGRPRGRPLGAKSGPASPVYRRAHGRGVPAVRGRRGGGWAEVR